MPNITEQNAEKELYVVRCTECGEKIGNKFFPLDSLLKQYSIGENFEKKVEKLAEFLGIGAMYGQTVLPEVPAFIDGIGNWRFGIPASFAGKQLPEFTCPDNEIPKDRLVPVNLNIASMIAQFCLNTGFTDIYSMLKLRKEIDDSFASFIGPSGEQIAQWKNYCDRIVRIPGVRVDPLLSSDQRDAVIAGYMSDIRRFAEEEAKTPGRKHFATQDFCIGWRYKIENHRKMPFALVVRGKLEGSFDTQECCCDKCRRAIHWEMGAYEQKIIGILGTQAAGKTTYLMALADVIKEVEFKKMTITHDVTDPQWKRVETENGLLWRYQNGFAPPKTAVGMREAPALTFKVQKSKRSKPIMYTLADIPGEAFYDTANGKYPQDMIDAIKRLLLSSDSLILVVNQDQLQKTNAAQSEGKASNLVKNASEILTSFKDYLPKRPISTAVILSAADKMGDLRKMLKLAYDIRKLPPLIDSEKDGKYVYNAEAMDTASQFVSKYMDDNFQQFMHNLRNGFVPEGSAVAAFAVSSGTQCAVEYEAGFDKEKAAARYADMCRERFGVAAPLLWLLACDGLLDMGRTDENFDRYEEKDRRRILDAITRKEP